MPSILKGLLLLCAYCAADDSQRQVGEFYCGSSDSWPWLLKAHPIHGLSKKHSVQVVNFSKPISKPVVFLSITYLDSDKSSNLRAAVDVDTVSDLGFTAECFTWHYTQISEMRITWLAVTADLLEQTGSFFCGKSWHYHPVLGNPKHPEVESRQYVQDVQFPKAFLDTPLIVLSVTDMDIDRNANLRFMAQVDNVTKSGVQAKCYTWSDTTIYQMRISWFAIPRNVVIRTGEFYCGNSNNWTSAVGNPKYPGTVGRRFIQKVKFNTRFKVRPVVFLSVTYLENDRLANLRFLAQVVKVNRKAFQAMCYTWEDTKISEMRVTWLAF
ncbi:hypothetical protein BsWGS_20768 [Bradybaena similaris]